MNVERQPKRGVGTHAAIEDPDNMMRAPLVGEVVPTPGRGKAHAAIVKHGQRILFVLPVDSVEEGHARIEQALALMAEMRAGTGPLPRFPGRTGRLDA